MNTKLTLRLEKSLIDHAKEYAQLHGKSVSQIVSDFFRVIPPSPEKRKLSPLTRKLYGCLKSTGAGEDEYRKHLERKYL